MMDAYSQTLVKKAEFLRVQTMFDRIDLGLQFWYFPCESSQTKAHVQAIRLLRTAEKRAFLEFTRGY